ncbi:MAG: hypothetical protein F4X65_00885 [Chloroflexi bacterium]|nr:hypothetical protein [Chloroflexota bacterium]
MLQPEGERVSVVAPNPLLHIAELVATERDQNYASIFVEWMRAGAENTVIELLNEGRISKGFAVEALGTTYFGLDELLKARDIRLGLTDEQLWESRETGRLPGILK